MFVMSFTSKPICYQYAKWHLFYGKWVLDAMNINGSLVCISGTIWRSWPTSKGKLSWLNGWMLLTQQLMMTRRRMMNEWIKPRLELLIISPIAFRYVAVLELNLEPSSLLKLPFLFSPLWIFAPLNGSVFRRKSDYGFFFFCMVWNVISVLTYSSQLDLCFEFGQFS